MAPSSLLHERASGNSRNSRRDENVLSLARPSALDQGSTALNLVYQAAEIFGCMEVQARETEARAQSLCKSAAERLNLAQERAKAAERDRRETIDEVDRKLQDASKALKQMESRIAAAEDYATAAEFRAQTAEHQARKLRQELALVEDAIRRRLLSVNFEGMARQNVA
jgi:type I site-specific restriction endonuclease